MPSQRDLAGAALIGAVSGLRTFTGPAVLAARGRLLPDSPVRYALLAAAAGEYLGDKTPLIPARTSPPSFGGRIASGALAGETLGGTAGAGIGAMAAVGGTLAGYHARAALGELTGLSTVILGAAEDGVALAAATLASRPDAEQDEPESDPRVKRVLRGAVRGAAAGVFGTAVMTGAQLALQRATGSDESRAPERVGRKLTKRVLGKRVKRGNRDILNQTMHWTYGTSWGVDLGVSAALAGSRPPLVAGGAGLGLAVWVAGLAQLPAFGVAPPPWKQSPTALAMDAGLHVVYGFAVTAALRALP
jgi:uncharacterized membrane protein